MGVGCVKMDEMPTGGASTIQALWSGTISVGTYRCQRRNTAGVKCKTLSCTDLLDKTFTRKTRDFVTMHFQWPTRLRGMSRHGCVDVTLVYRNVMTLISCQIFNQSKGFRLYTKVMFFRNNSKWILNISQRIGFRLSPRGRLRHAVHSSLPNYSADQQPPPNL